MQDISLHILDIVENSLSANADKIFIRIVQNLRRDLLTLEIRDNGKGMDSKTTEKALDPFFTSKTRKKVGLGLPLLAQAAREAEGKLTIESRPGSGTYIRATFCFSHPDRKPLGDVVGTVRLLRMTHPEIDLQYDFIKE